MIRIALVLLLSLMAPAGALAQSGEKPVSIVLVHGAFVDGSGWKAVFDILTGEGYEVLVVQNPTISLKGDVAATQQVIAAARHPVILVGHSYGGMVITEAGDNPKVREPGLPRGLCARRRRVGGIACRTAGAAGRIGRAAAAAP